MMVGAAARGKVAPSVSATASRHALLIVVSFVCPSAATGQGDVADLKISERDVTVLTAALPARAGSLAVVAQGIEERSALEEALSPNRRP